MRFSSDSRTRARERSATARERPSVVMSNTTSSPMTSTRRAGITAPLVNQQVFGWWRAALKVDGEGCPTRSRCGSRSNNVHAHDVLHSDEVAARPFVVGEYEARGGPGHNHPAGAMSAAEHEGSILQRGDDLDECRGIAGPRGVSCAGCRARGFQRVHGVRSTGGREGLRMRSEQWR